MSDTGPVRGRPRDPEVDLAIIETAVEILTETGFNGFTIEQLADRAGVSKTSIYRRFANRSELLEAVCTEFAPDLPEAPDCDDPAEAMVTLLTGMAEAMADPDLGGPLPAILAASGSHPEARDALGRFSRTRRRPLLQVLERARDDGALPGDTDPEVIADLMAGAILFRSLVLGNEVTEERVRLYVAAIGL